MDAFGVLLEQIDKEVASCKEHLADGRVPDIETYKNVCGQIRGLLLARGFIADLKHKTEYEDE